MIRKDIIIENKQEPELRHWPWRDRWLEQGADAALLHEERCLCERLLAHARGQYALQIVPPQVDLLASVPIMRKLTLQLDSAQEPDGASLVCRAEAFAFASESIDLVVLLHALELACDPQAMLREIVRVLAEEGRLLIISFNRRSLWGLYDLFRSWGPHSTRKRRRVSPEQVRSWLLLLGLAPVREYGLHLFPLWRGTRSQGRTLPAPLHRWGKVYVLEMQKRLLPLDPIVPRKARSAALASGLCGSVSCRQGM